MIISSSEVKINQTGRLVHYDFLRILACFSVIMLHSASQFWYDLPVSGRQWIIANSYDSIFRFGVPIFVMISGALFLNPARKLNIRKLYTHNIIRLVTAFLFWSCFYGLWDARKFDLVQAGIKPVLLEMMSGRYHLWFVPMLTGIYMLLPILRTWTKNAGKKELCYFLGLFFVMQILRETFYVFVLSPNVKQFAGSIDIEMACSYIGYFVLGYYIAHVGIPKKYHKWIYTAGGVGLAGALFFGSFLSILRDTPSAAAYDSYSIFTFFVVVSLFLFFQEVPGKIQFPQWAVRIAGELSAATFGIYLLHIWVLEELMDRGIHSMIVPNLIGIPMVALLCFFICCVAVALIRRIPFIGKYIS